MDSGAGPKEPRLDSDPSREEALLRDLRSVVAGLLKSVVNFMIGLYRLQHSKLWKTRIPSGIWLRLFHQLSTHIVPPRSNVREARLNTHGQKFDPESLY